MLHVQGTVDDNSRSEQRRIAMAMKDKEVTWTKVQVVQLEYIDKAPYLYYWFRCTNKLGTKPNHISSLIRDPDLLKRVKTELASGDIVEVDFVNNEQGYGTVLRDFRILKRIEGSRQLHRCIWPSGGRIVEIFRRWWAEHGGNELTKKA